MDAADVNCPRTVLEDDAEKRRSGLRCCLEAGCVRPLARNLQPRVLRAGRINGWRKDHDVSVFNSQCFCEASRSGSRMEEAGTFASEPRNLGTSGTHWKPHVE